LLPNGIFGNLCNSFVRAFPRGSPVVKGDVFMRHSLRCGVASSGVLASECDSAQRGPPPRADPVDDGLIRE
jgi:hypothetical protein